MITLDELFHTSADIPPHPRMRDWKRLLAQPGTKANLELYSPEMLLGIVQTEMNLHFTGNGEPHPVETMAWDDDVNTGLIQLGVRSINSDQEAERFALGLRGAFQKAQSEFGDGYLNSMLVEFISDSDLTQYEEIAEILEHSFALSPKREGKAEQRYNLCRQMIADAISGRAHELKDKLGYSEEEAKAILVQALARYLDERFSVSSRRRLGLI